MKRTKPPTERAIARMMDVRPWRSIYPRAPQTDDEREAANVGPATTECGAENRRGDGGVWTCTRPPGHDGFHMAGDGVQIVCPPWSGLPEAARHVEPVRAVLTPEERAAVEQCRDRDARDEDNSAILDRASLLAILDRIAPKG